MDTLIPLPKDLPETQSFYYMPLLTHAYYIVKNIEVSEILKKHIKSIQQLPLLSEERYTSMLEGIIWFLTHDGKSYIDTMERLYNSDTPHNNHNIGHIPGEIQSEILEKSYLGDSKYDLYFKHFKNETYNQDKRIIKNIFDSMLVCYYYDKEICNNFYDEEVIYQKYIKYKNKYLQFKNKLKNKV